jgi:hypothetical protein
MRFCPNAPTQLIPRSVPSKAIGLIFNSKVDYTSVFDFVHRGYLPRCACPFDLLAPLDS